MKVLADLVRAEDLLPGLQVAVLRVSSHGESREREQALSGLLYKGTNPTTRASLSLLD